MTVEQKAKRIERIFPELKENEDEKIRKEIISHLQYLAKYCSEQKSADKVEPKFKIGDWITDGYLHCKISDVLDDRYIVDTKFGKRSAIPFKRENNYHLWSIQDAKDGDILIYNDSIFIFDEIYENDLIYYGIYEHNKFHNDKYYSFLDLNTININNIYPATKEQRDLLFQKMKEVGYEWDEKKKELKIIDWNKHIKYEPNCPSIIEENTEWSEDEKIRKALISILKSDFEDDTTIFGISVGEIIAWLEKQKGCEYIKKEWLEHIKQSWYNEGFIDGKYSGGTSKEWTINDATILKELIDFLENGTIKLQHDLTLYANWLKIQFAPNESKILLKQKPIDYNEELKKCRENPLYFFDKYVKLKIKKQKPAWSEEDEKMVNDIIAAIDTLHYHGMVKWLKSLKQRMNNV